MGFSRKRARVWTLAVAGAVAAAVLVAPAAHADPVDPGAVVSSASGQPVAAPPTGQQLTPEFAGTIGARTPTAADLAQYGARPATTQDLRNFQEAQPPTVGGDGVGPSSVIGRDGRARVRNTKAFPARATVQILFGGGYLCSGWLVGPDTVVTAGHCVAGSGNFFNAATYTIAPGFNDQKAPYGVCGAEVLYTVAGWLNGQSSEYDYGAIKLDCTIGTLTGGFGYTTVGAARNRVTVQGYPGDKPSGTQWKMSGTLTATYERTISYPIDTFGGQSGSAVWGKAATGKCKVCAIGIHAYGAGGQPPANSGTRITQEVFDNITYWRAQP